MVSCSLIKWSVVLLVTFHDSTLNTANLCPAISVVGLFYLLTVMYTFVWFGTLVHFRWTVHSKLWNVGEVSVLCIMSVLVLVYSGRDVSSSLRSI